MQQQLSLWKTPTPAGIAPEWTALDEGQRAEAVAALARLIAKVAADRYEVPVASAEEASDE